MGSWLQVCCRTEHLQLLLLYQAIGLSSNLVAFVVFVLLIFVYVFLFSVVVMFFYVVACVALLVRSCTITYIIFTALVVGS